jgi:xanthine dehydrogenase YagR molybdenum-binding subunit
MDELAAKLQMDPVDLRRLNDTMAEPIDGKPYSSRSLMACFDAVPKRSDGRLANRSRSRCRMATG